MDTVALKSSYEAVRHKVPSSVTLVAASKGQPREALEALYRLGHRDFGENYVQELLDKAAWLEERGCAGIRWHLIGHLQTNKVKAVVESVDCVHSVDSERLAEELARRWRSAGRAGRLAVFLEVNLDGEASKSGVSPDEVRTLAEAVGRHPELELQGLMAIPDPGRDGAAAFRRLRELEATLRPLTRGALSMGMSSDYELAIREGATHVRVGTLLFGPRK